MALVHDFAEGWVKGFEQIYPKNRERTKPQISFLGWWHVNKVKAIHTERVVYSKEHGDAGTLDFEGKINRKL